MPDTPFYLGSELDRAVNRMDFFRLFKALAIDYNRQWFLLFEIPGEDGGVNLQNTRSLHNFPDPELGISDDGSIGGADPFVVKTSCSVAPFYMNLRQASSGLFRLSECEGVVAVPLHTPTARRYCLVMFGDDKETSHEELALIALSSALLFQRYFDAILSLDSITGLSDREIQIVRWTSEGKTSYEMAVILGMSEHTVNSYISTCLRKLNVVNRAQMVASALRSGLIA